MTKRGVSIKKGGNKQSEAIPIRQTDASRAFGENNKVYDEKFPISILTHSNRGRGDRGMHPTQKPVSLMAELILSHTLPGETVLDNCMGSGTTGVAAAQLGRCFIGMERDPGYFAAAEARIRAAKTAVIKLEEAA